MTTKKHITKLKDNRSKNSNLWILFAVPIIIAAIFLFGQLKDRNQQSRLNSNGNSTICSVTDKGYTKGPDIIVEYYVNNRKYIKRCGSPCIIDVGEEFEIIYNTNDPSDSKIIFFNPIIPKAYSSIKGKITRIDNSFFKRVQYSYIINSKIFFREQVVKDEADVSLDQEVSVYYNDNNPEKSYIKW